MVNESEIVTLIQEAKKSEKERKFKESLELYITLKDIDVKKGFAFNFSWHTNAKRTLFWIMESLEFI